MYNDDYIRGLSEIKALLKGKGWKIMKNPYNRADDYCAQGVIYMNFRKGEKAIHLEYGNEDCV